MFLSFLILPTFVPLVKITAPVPNGGITTLITAPDPVIHIAIEPKGKGDYEKMVHSLRKLMQEDPSFRFSYDPETSQTIISGMGELHLEIIVDRLLREYKVESNVGKAQVAYKETIQRSVEVEGKFIRQSGGHGQYGAWLHEPVR